MNEPTTWDEALETVLEMQRSIMVERQAKYGPQNIIDQGLYGVLTRASADKAARVKHALNGRIVNGEIILDPIEDGSDVADTFEDGCLDAANYYGPIAIMLRRGWWTLPRRPTWREASQALIAEGADQDEPSPAEVRHERLLEGDEPFEEIGPIPAVRRVLNGGPCLYELWGSPCGMTYAGTHFASSADIRHEYQP